MSDSEQFLNRLELDLISLLVNFSSELGQIGGSVKKKVQSGATNLIRFYIALNWGEKWFLPSKKQTWQIFKVANFGDSKERRVV